MAGSFVDARRVSNAADAVRGYSASLSELMSSIRVLFACQRVRSMKYVYHQRIYNPADSIQLQVVPVLCAVYMLLNSDQGEPDSSSSRE